MPSPKFSLKIGRWTFIPRVKLTILAVIVFSCLVYLGYWQLQRADEKKSFIAHQQARAELPPVKFTSLKNPSLHTDRYLQVSVDGVFMNQYTYLLDNQVFDRLPGFRVLTPMHIPNLDRWVLIDRGWIAMGKDRAHLPQIDPIFGLQRVVGQIDTITTGVVWVKDTTSQNPKWPLLIQEIDYQLISEQFQHPIYKFVVRVHPDTKHSFIFPPLNMNMDHTKHIAYAIQWFTFAFMVLVYYVVMCTQRRKK